MEVGNGCPDVPAVGREPSADDVRTSDMKLSDRTSEYVYPKLVADNFNFWELWHEVEGLSDGWLARDSLIEA